MAKTKISSIRKKALTTKDLGVYISLLTDFGFKRIFGIKEVMIKFLNTVLDIEGGIKDLRYGSPEKLGFSQFDRKAVYDLYCITENNEHIIVEIQCISQVYFKDRTLLYTARLINEQSVKGKNWDFKLPPVYSINILDFSFEEALLPLGVRIERTDKNKYISKVQLIDCDTGEIFYDKLIFYYIELPRFTKELQELKTFLEQWIFIIKHLHELNDLPKELCNNKIFELLFEIAQIARMTPKDVNNYLKDLNNMNIVRNEIRGLRNIISERDNALAAERNVFETERNVFQSTLAQKDNTISNQSNIIAEYERRYGVLKFSMQ
jgi:predicted transposase/invertase (TIGR01784 family)